MHFIICSIELKDLYLYNYKFKVYEIIVFKCRTN